MSVEPIIDELNEECGVFGVFGHEDAVQLTYYGLHALQHRGQESCGIVSSDGHRFTAHRDTGLVTEVFDAEALQKLSGHMAIGHVRYSTRDERSPANVQPLLFNYHDGELALAMNGSLVNASQIKHQLERMGSIFQTTSDTEVIAHLIARSGYSELKQVVKESLRMVKGAYAFLIMTKDCLIAALDPHGIRPLSIGKLGDSYVFASETCAFDAIGAEYVREVAPGELLVLDGDGMHVDRLTGQTRRAVCTFEYIYFARPDSDIDGQNVHSVRKRLGKQLFVEAPVEADVVSGVPDSSISAAIGYAEAAGYPYELGLIKNRYIARTFIQPSQQLREQGVKMKLSAVRRVVEGQRVVLIDDSIVRGTTIKRIVKLLRQVGATEVHVRISSPPVKNPCFYGIDTADRNGLIAANHSPQDIRQLIGADSLAFLSLEGLLEAVGRPADEVNRGHCLACFDGVYPTEIYEDLSS